MFNLRRENTSIIAKWWRNVDKQILFLFTFLFLLGLFFSFASTSYVVAEKMNKETYFFFKKHLFFVLASLILIIIISLQDKEKLIKLLTISFFVSVLLLALVPLIGTEVKGSKRWIDLFFIPRFQPVEFVKPLLIIYMAKIIITNKKINIYYRYIHSFFIKIHHVTNF